MLDSVTRRRPWSANFRQVLKEWWAEACIGIAGLGGTAASAFPDKRLEIAFIDSPIPILSFFISIVLLGGGGIGVVRKKRSVKVILEEANKYKDIADKYKKDTRELIQDNLRDLSADCGLSKGDQACISDTRISVYCYENNNRVFIPIARISGNPNYEEQGRAWYPDNQGVIAKAWRDAFFSYGVEGVESEEEWVQEQVKSFNFTEEEARALSMKSMSFIAWQIRYQDQSIGVVVIESTDKERANVELIEKVETSPFFPPLKRALYRINESHIPHIAAGLELY